GGHPTPAAGFAIGMERLVSLLSPLSSTASHLPDVYFITMGDIAIQKGIILSEYLRENLITMRLILDVTRDAIKTQFKRADKSGARFALILGENEVKSNTLIIKNLKERNPQETISQDHVIQKLRECLIHE
ncbi:His/Gly/Thr/Pro-type tRNA ligase C-terminal domain-containing protein, partial [Rickettsiella grylli]|uniref:His/Gly/Thr/Pro-type tRNA ligase C-terminal domain-containing protein n=1 Tax=Rickettsiella grylli TaxID=59196 RepID=UPI000B2D7C8E